MCALNNDLTPALVHFMIDTSSYLPYNSAKFPQIPPGSQDARGVFNITRIEAWSC